MDAEHFSIFAQRQADQVARVVVGQSEALRLLYIALIAGGHVLLEGPPGTAKTLLCRAFAKTLKMQFRRIQFTPDLMPGDVLGSNVFNFQKSEFALVEGPIFTELLLADEINRTPPKTQSALLEAMNERSVTIDGETRALSPGFMVVATQNPIEQQGTYPLPEAQLDRFLFMHVFDYPDRAQEIEIVMNHGDQPSLDSVAQVTDIDEILRLRAKIATLRVSPEIGAYTVDLVRATRANPSLSYGASPRAAAMLTRAARVNAALEGRDFVIPDDVKTLFLPVLRHRVVVSPSAEIDGRHASGILAEILEQIEAPK